MRYLLLLTLFVPDLDIVLPPVNPVKGLYYGRKIYISTGDSVREQEKLPPKNQTGVVRISDAGAPFPVIVTMSAIAPISTVDMPVEAGWCDKVTAVIPAGKVQNYAYDPETSMRSVYTANFLCFARLIVSYMHPNRTSIYEDAHMFMLPGYPFALGLLEENIPDPTRLRVTMSMKDIARYMGRATTPSLTKYDGTYKIMLENLLRVELSSYAPFSLAPFAEGLELFDIEEMYNNATKMLDDKNDIIRRNAVYFLGTMMKYEPMKDLMDLLTESKDMVQRFRALYFLTISDFPGLRDYLQKHLTKERDPLMRAAFINALGELGHPASFDILVDMLAKSAGDPDIVSALVSACLRCFDKEDKKSQKQLITLLNRLEEVIKSKGSSPAISFVPEAEKRLIQDALNIVGALMTKSREKQLFSRIKKGGRVIGQPIGIALGDYNEFLGEIRAPESGRFNSFQTQIIPDLVWLLPRFEQGKKLLEEVLTDQDEHDDILTTAFITYTQHYPSEAEDMFLRFADGCKNARLLDRAIKTLFTQGAYTQKTLDYLSKQLLLYEPNMDSLGKHLVTLAVHYLNKKGLLRSDKLIEIIRGELNIRGEVPLKDLLVDKLYYLRIPPESYLIKHCVNALGRIADRKSEEMLLQLTAEDDRVLRTIAIKNLSEFRSPAVIDRLKRLLSDEDGWTRLASYLTLERITGVKHRVDWFFAGKEDIEKEAAAFCDMLDKKGSLGGD